jgi:hypothetical protein
MVELPADVEQTLRDLPDSEWTALQARVRPPDTAEQVRSAVARHVGQDQLDQIMGIVDPTKLLGDDGQVDQRKVQEHFGALFRTQQPEQRRQWGQSSTAGGPPKQPGDDARTALKKRHGVKNEDTTQPGAASRITPGDEARAALQRRHGVKGQQK